MSRGLSPEVTLLITSLMFATLSQACVTICEILIKMAFLAGQFAAVGRKQAARIVALLLCFVKKRASLARFTGARQMFHVHELNCGLRIVRAVSIWNSKLTPYRLFLRLEFRGPHALSTWRRRPAAGTLFRCYR